ncbi:AI-2E family transporter [Vulgatibacter sp.]|uniref:AI-2E family transporter n=1 Tax=Vulgatibacter sp. TaxID=1971226 RepID=UPI0035668A5D
MDSRSKARPKSYLLIVALLWLAIAAVLVVFHQVLLPFGVALLVAYVIEPLVTRIAGYRVGGRNVPRWGAILLLYAAFFGVVYLFSVAALPQLYRELVRLTAEAREFLNALTPTRIAWYIRVAEDWLTTHGIPIALGDESLQVGDLTAAQPGAAQLAVGADQAAEGAKLHLDLEAAIRNSIANGSAWLRSHFLDVVGYSQRVLAGLFGGVFMLFFVLMVTAFLLIDVRGIQRFFRSMVPPEHLGDYDDLLRRIDRKLAGVVRGQIVICLVNGVLTLVGLLLLKVKFAFVLATVATVLSFIPIFGTIISTIPIVLVGLSQSFSTGVAALAWILGIHAVEAYLLNPKIMGTAAKIHPALIAFALLAGERTFGFVGALFAVPVASILLATFGHFKSRADRMQAEADGVPPPLDDEAPEVAIASAGPSGTS